jgi:hypothetical protein
MTSIRRVLALGVLIALVAGCGLLGSGGGSLDAREITYEVSYADLSAGEAEVTYTNAAGDPVTATVTTPWASEPIKVKDGQRYDLGVSASPRDGSNLVCGVHTDTGWNADNSRPGGECRYSFPDDAAD